MSLLQPAEAVQLLYLTQHMTLTDGDGERVHVICDISPRFLSQTGAARQIEDMHRRTQCHGSKCLIHHPPNQPIKPFGTTFVAAGPKCMSGEHTYPTESEAFGCLTHSRYDT